MFFELIFALLSHLFLPLLWRYIIQNAVTPGEPTVRVFDGGRNEFTAAAASVNRSLDTEVLKVGPLDEGSMAVVECSTSGGRPQPDVKWMNGTHVLRNKISISANPDSSTSVTSTAKFIISRYDLGSVLTCSVSNNATHHPLSRQVSFDVRGMRELTTAFGFLC